MREWKLTVKVWVWCKIMVWKQDLWFIPKLIQTFIQIMCSPPPQTVWCPEKRCKHLFRKSFWSSSASSSQHWPTTEKPFNPFSPEAVLSLARWAGWIFRVSNGHMKTYSTHTTDFTILCDSGIKPRQNMVLQYLWVDSKGFFQGVAVFPHPEREVPVALVNGGDPLPNFSGMYVSFFYKAVSQLDEELHFLLCLLPKIRSLVMFYYYFFCF